MFVIGALGAVVVALLRRSLPESPRWLGPRTGGRRGGRRGRGAGSRPSAAATELPEPDAVHARAVA